MLAAGAVNAADQTAAIGESQCHDHTAKDVEPYARDALPSASEAPNAIEPG